MVNKSYSNKILSIADFISASALVAGITYNLCASTYLTPFILSNAAHLGASHLLKYAVANNILTKETANIAETAFICSTIYFSFVGFENSLDALMKSSPLNKSPLVQAILVSGIPDLCFGIINKISNLTYNPTQSSGQKPEYSYGSSILFNNLKESFAHYIKYYSQYTMFDNALYGATVGGAAKYLISYGFSSNKPKGYKFEQGLALSALGAANHTVYQLINYGNDLTNILLFYAVEALDTVLATGTKNYFQKLAKQPEMGKEKSY